MTTLPPATAPKPSIWVKEIETQDGAALLDIHQGLCLSVNAVGAEMWRLLTQNNSLDEMADQVATKFDAPAARVVDDAKKFVSNLSQHGLLVTNNNARTAATKLRIAAANYWRPNPLVKKTNDAKFLVAKSLIALAAFDCVGLGNDFQAMYEIVRLWPIAPGPADPAVIDHVCTSMNYACVWYPKRVLCLQRSTITTCLLRNCGVPARMAIGAQKLPFKAHAWVEVEGRAINEFLDVQATYLVWDRC
jgi:hypothetical protein